MNTFISLLSALAKRRAARTILLIPWFSPKYAIAVINFYYPKRVDIYFRWNGHAEQAFNDELKESTLGNYRRVDRLTRRYDVIVSDYALEANEFIFFTEHLSTKGTILYIKEGVVYAGRSLADIQKV